MRKVLFLLIVLVQMIVLSCLENNNLDNAKSEFVLASNPANYQWVYHFGESEWETNLVLIYANEMWYGQIKSGHWSESGPEDWIF